MDAPSRPTHSDINANLLHVIRLLGEENDEGTGGSGVLGRLARIEHRQAVYDRWFQRVIGFGMSASAFITVIWWLTKDRWTELFK